MSLARVLIVTAVLMCCLPVSLTHARGCRLLARRCGRSRSAPCHTCQVAAHALGEGKTCRNALLQDFEVFCLYSCVVCDDPTEGAFELADCGLPVDDVGDPCDDNPPGACESAMLKRVKVEGVYIKDEFAANGVQIDAEPKRTAGLRVVDVEYEITKLKHYARVYIRGDRAIALPISKAKASNPQLATAKLHSGKVDVLTAKLADGTRIKCASVREK